MIQQTWDEELPFYLILKIQLVVKLITSKVYNHAIIIQMSSKGALAATSKFSQIMVQVHTVVNLRTTFSEGQRFMVRLGLTVWQDPSCTHTIPLNRWVLATSIFWIRRRQFNRQDTVRKNCNMESISNQNCTIKISKMKDDQMHKTTRSSIQYLYLNTTANLMLK